MKTKEDYVRKAIVVSIHDGDTITVNVDLGYRVFTVIPLRLNRINSPELRTDAGKIAKNFLLTKITVGSEITVKTYKNPTDKYSRWLADIYVGDECINDLMVSSGNAKYYDGTGLKI